MSCHLGVETIKINKKLAIHSPIRKPQGEDGLRLPPLPDRMPVSDNGRVRFLLSLATGDDVGLLRTKLLDGLVNAIANCCVARIGPGFIDGEPFLRRRWLF